MSIALQERYTKPKEPKNAEVLRFNSGFNDPSRLAIYGEYLKRIPGIAAQKFAPEEIALAIGKGMGDIKRASSLGPIHHQAYGGYELLVRAEIANPETDHILDFGCGTGASWEVARTRPFSAELVDEDSVIVRLAQGLERLPAGYRITKGDTSYQSETRVSGTLMAMVGQYLRDGEKDVYKVLKKAAVWGSSTDLVHTASPIPVTALDSRGHLKLGAIIPVDPLVQTGLAYMIEAKGERLRKNMYSYKVATVFDTQVYDDKKLSVRSLPDVEYASLAVLYTYPNGEKSLLPWFIKPNENTEESVESIARAVGLMEYMFRRQGFDARNNVRVAAEVMKDPDAFAVVLSCAGGDKTVTNEVLVGLFQRYFDPDMVHKLDKAGALKEIVGRGRLFPDANAINELVNNPDSWASISRMQSPPFHSIFTFWEKQNYEKFRDFLS